MYVRWQIRKKRATRWEPHALHRAAILVENTRVNGRPTQRHIAYLVGFTKSQTWERSKYSLPRRCSIWAEVDKKLDRLGNRITPQDRTKIEAAIAEKVPRPTAAEWEENNRRRAELGIDSIDLENS
jgi:hypothetical protein